MILRIMNQSGSSNTSDEDPTQRQSFPKNKRLLSNEQFKTVLEHRRRSSNGLLTLYMASNDCDHARLGVSVGKSYGGAVVRNRLKRLLREAFRQTQQQIPAGFDYVVMISNRRAKGPEVAGQLTFEQVRASFLALAKTEDRRQKTDDRRHKSDF